MISLKDILNDEHIQKEYEKALLLNMFKKLVIKMNKEEHFKLSVKKLYIQSTNKEITIKILIEKHFQYHLTDGDSKKMLLWFDAYFRKNNRRKPFTHDFKKKLISLQRGKCMVCGEQLGDDLSKIHVDHIIPWVLVGDELEDNYQCLCEMCNECKSAHTDYIFKNLINLN